MSLRPQSTTALQMDKMLEGMQHIKVIATQELYIPASPPIVRFCRPAERDAINAILSPTFLLPIEHAYRRPSILVPVRQEMSDSASMPIAEALTSTELYALNQDTKTRVSPDRMTPVVSMSKRHRRFASIQETLANSEAIEVPMGSSTSKRDSVVSCSTSLTDCVPHPAYVGALVTRPLRKRLDTLGSEDRGLVKYSGGLTDETSHYDSHAESLEVRPQKSTETLGRPDRLRLSLTTTRDSFDAALIPPVIKKVGRFTLANTAAVEDIASETKRTSRLLKEVSEISSRFNCTLTLESLGVAVSLRDIGDVQGTPILLIQGIEHTDFVAASLDKIAQTLRLRIINISRPGHQKTPALSKKTSWDYPKIAAEVFSQLKLTKYSILAHAEGAAYALQLAEAHTSSSRPLIVLLAPKISSEFLLAALDLCSVRLVEPTVRRRQRSCFSCLSPRQDHLASSGESDLYRESSSPPTFLSYSTDRSRDIAEDLSQYENVRLKTPLHKLPGKYKIVQMKDDEGNSIEHNRCLQSWLHDCELYEWNDPDDVPHQPVWEISNLMTDVLTLVAANVRT